MPAGGSETERADEEAREGGLLALFMQADGDDSNDDKRTPESSEVPPSSIQAAVPGMAVCLCDVESGPKTSTSDVRRDSDADADASDYVTDVQVRALLVGENAILQIETEIITIESDDENADASPWHPGLVGTPCQQNCRSTSPASAALARARLSEADMRI